MSNNSLLDQAIKDMAKRLDDIQSEIEVAVSVKKYGANYSGAQRSKIKALLDPDRGASMGQVFSPDGIEAWFVLYADTEKGECGYELHHLNDKQDEKN